MRPFNLVAFSSSLAGLIITACLWLATPDQAALLVAPRAAAADIVSTAWAVPLRPSFGSHDPACASAAWRFVMSQPDRRALLEAIFERSDQPAGRLLALAGLRIVDSGAAGTRIEQWRRRLRPADSVPVTATDNDGPRPVTAALELVEDGQVTRGLLLDHATLFQACY